MLSDPLEAPSLLLEKESLVYDTNLAWGSLEVIWDFKKRQKDESDFWVSAVALPKLIIHRRNIAGSVPIKWEVNGHITLNEIIKTLSTYAYRCITLQAHETMAPILEDGKNIHLREYIGHFSVEELYATRPDVEATASGIC